MKRNVSIIIALSLLFTAVLGFAQAGFGSDLAAPLIQKVNAESGVVTASQLNVRQKPSTLSKITCTLKKGQTVNIFAKMGDWYAIYDPSSSCVGVVNKKYIKLGAVAAKKSTNQKSVPKVTPKPIPSTLPQYGPQATAKPTAAVTGVSADEQSVLDLVNKARRDAGVAPLSFDATLQKVARAKAQDMVNNNYFSHQSPTYGSPFDMMRQFGVNFKTAGENIAGNNTVQGAFDAWMKSSGHKKNILNSNYNYTGIGIVSSPTYGKMFVQEFIGR